MSRFKLLDEHTFGSGGEVRHKQKEKILVAAEKEFMKYGFEGASITRIAKLAELPRTNVHYYFTSKLEMYGTLLTNAIELWNDAFRDIKATDDPKEALSNYIDAKIDYSRLYPEVSIIFTSEILHGAPHLTEYLNTNFKTWINTKAAIIDSWIALGKLDPVSPHHLLFLIWSATQHYANAAVEVEAAFGRPLNLDDFEQAKQTIKHIVLKGCGL